MMTNTNHKSEFANVVKVRYVISLLLLLLFAGAGIAKGEDVLIEKEQTTTKQNLQGTSAQPAQSAAVGLSTGKGMPFTPNKGQIADMNGKFCADVLYQSEGNGADIYLRKTGISYVYNDMGEVMHDVHEKVEELVKAGIITEAEEHAKQDELMKNESIKVHRVDMDFEGTNSKIRLLNEGEVEGYQNYYYSHCPEGVTNVHQYNKVTYKNIYNNIDITYYGSASLTTGSDKQKGVKYDLIVQPHADPNQIKFSWKGAESIYLNSQGKNY
ncbi:MAG: hypothetical protein HYU69_04120 [Bacteroidetes bacterium]|nr:hypothetical protein [Bacteroidota bacterium]